MLYLKKEDYEKILAHCKEGLPNEACGLIGGTIEGDKRSIQKVYLLTNIDQSNEHFSMDPKEQLAAVKDMRANGLKLLATFILIRNHHQDHLKKIKDWHMIQKSII